MDQWKNDYCEHCPLRYTLRHKYPTLDTLSARRDLAPGIPMASWPLWPPWPPWIHYCEHCPLRWAPLDVSTKRGVSLVQGPFWVWVYPQCRHTHPRTYLHTPLNITIHTHTLGGTGTRDTHPTP